MKIIHEMTWEPLQGKYRILRLTGDKRQPTLNEAMEYMRRNHLPEEVWACAFYNNPDRYDDYLDDGKEDKTLTLLEYTGHHGDADDGICPICGMAIDLFHDKDKCPLCGKEW